MTLHSAETVEAIQQTVDTVGRRRHEFRTGHPWKGHSLNHCQRPLLCFCHLDFITRPRSNSHGQIHCVWQILSLSFIKLYDFHSGESLIGSLALLDAVSSTDEAPQRCKALGLWVGRIAPLRDMPALILPADIMSGESRRKQPSTLAICTARFCLEQFKESEGKPCREQNSYERFTVQSPHNITFPFEIPSVPYPIGGLGIPHHSATVIMLPMNAAAPSPSLMWCSTQEICLRSMGLIVAIITLNTITFEKLW